MSDENKDDMKPVRSEHLNVTVKGQDGGVVQFKIKRSTPFRKLMTAYCERACIAPGGVRFIFDGMPISEQQTPAGLEMEDNDSIDVFQQQTGGHHP